MPVTEERPHYSREEMDAILQRALQRQSTKREGVSHDELVAAAEEIGLPREEIEAAARDLAAEKARQAAEKEKLAPLEDQRTRMKMRLVRGYALWLVLGATFFTLSRATHEHGLVWPIAIMGIILAMRTVNVFFGPVPEQRESRSERKARKRDEKLREFERKVAIGTDAVVRVVEATRGKAKSAKVDVHAPARKEGPKIDAAPLVSAFDAFAKRGGARSAPAASRTSESDATASARNRVETSTARARVERDDDVSDEDELEADVPARSQGR